MAYVLANDDDIVIWPMTVATEVQEAGVKATAERYGVSEGKLRQFLNHNGWHGKRSTSWEKDEEIPQVPVPAGEDEVPF